MQLGRYLARHLQAGLNSFGKLTRSPFSTLATCLIIGIALALPTGLFVALKNAEVISGSFQQTMQLTLYMKQTTPESRVIDLAKNLKSNPSIEDTEVVSPEQGLAELQKQAGFDNSLNNLAQNPLPWVIIVYPKQFHNTKFVERLSKKLQTLPDVENVQVDLLWVKRLMKLVQVAHRFAYFLAIFLGIGVLLIVNNAIRSATEWHRKEIELIRLIGGTNNFIRRPFLYTGMIYGALGGLLAWQLVDFATYLLNEPVSQLAKLYDSPFHLNGMTISNITILFATSILLGFIGSWVAVTKHLMDSEES